MRYRLQSSAQISFSGSTESWGATSTFADGDRTCVLEAGVRGRFLKMGVGVGGTPNSGCRLWLRWSCAPYRLRAELPQTLCLQHPEQLQRCSQAPPVIHVSGQWPFCAPWQLRVLTLHRRRAGEGLESGEGWRLGADGGRQVPIH